MPPAYVTPKGTRFGKLVTQEDAPRSTLPVPCVCDCGKEKSIVLSSLRMGNTRSCGCLLGEHARNGALSYTTPTGTRFGRLVTREDGTRSPQYVSCVCDCGNETRVELRVLRSGGTSSCGCGQRDAVSALRIQQPAGSRFGRLATLEARYISEGDGKVLCRCDCGVEKRIDFSSLRSGAVQSCGCLQREVVREAHVTHGLSGTPEYHALFCAIRRCTDPTDSAWDRYGGRGIRVCEQWQGANGITRFLGDIGPRPSPKHSLDRWPNNDGNYEPGNVQWRTMKEQGRNKSSNVLLTVDGITAPMSAHAERVGIPYSTLCQRVYKGWPHDKAVHEPVRKKRKST